jgi:NDP-sugar pyrophosphorylase family protein
MLRRSKLAHDLDGVTSVILAGGLGTRLRSMVADRPKVLAEVNGRPFLAYLLDQLYLGGVSKVILCTGYLGEQVRALFGRSFGGMDLAYSHESLPLGTGGALRLALPLIESNCVLVMNGDSICDVDLSAFHHFHLAKRSLATLLLTKTESCARYGRVRVSADGTVLAFEEKSGSNEPGWINAGVYFIERSLIGEISQSLEVSLEKNIFPSWIGRRFYAWQGGGRFLDIGTPESLAEAGRYFPCKISVMS